MHVNSLLFREYIRESTVRLFVPAQSELFHSIITKYLVITAEFDGREQSYVLEILELNT